MNRPLVILCVLLFTAFTPVCLQAQTEGQRHEGAKPYSPSRLGWLAVEVAVTIVPNESFSILLIPIENKDAIQIYVRYVPNVDRRLMNDAIAKVRQAIQISAKSHGWEDWLNIQEDVAPW